MLQTNLTHITSEQEFQDTLKNHDQVMVCCGRMGPMCIPIYGIMEELEGKYKNVAFRDMEFDAPHAHVIRNLPECKDFRGLPFTVYYKDGNVVKATTSLQTRDQITEILDQHFAAKHPV